VGVVVPLDTLTVKVAEPNGVEAEAHLEIAQTWAAVLSTEQAAVAPVSINPQAVVGLVVPGVNTF